MFTELARLTRVRDRLAAIPVASTNPETARAIVEGIRELSDSIDALNDAMVVWVRAEHFAATANEAAPIPDAMPEVFDMARFANDFLRGMTDVQTMAVVAS